MISRIRIEAYGRNAAHVEEQLLDFATAVDEKLGASETAYGEMVIERQLEEPYGSDFAFKGRQTLHPTVGKSPFVSSSNIVANGVTFTSSSGTLNAAA